jgi:MerR family transcriptional regulator, redox-sensitive transcriptional activator SoxR
MDYLQDDATASSGLEGKNYFAEKFPALAYNRPMVDEAKSSWSISEIARRVGLRTSAIRYYEQIGILERARRVSGQRRYDEAVLYRLAVVRTAQEAGFTLDEIRRLFFGFPQSTPVSQRWKRISERKMVELDARIAQIQSMRKLLKKLETCCDCETVERCGAGILAADERG